MGLLAATVRLSTETKFHEAKERLIKETQALENGKARLEASLRTGGRGTVEPIQQDLLVLFRDEPTDEAGRWRRQGPHQERLLGHSDAGNFRSSRDGRRRTSKKKAVDGVLKEMNASRNTSRCLVGLPAKQWCCGMTKDKVDPAIWT